jgi:phenylacetate-CoA ligase
MGEARAQFWNSSMETMPLVLLQELETRLIRTQLEYVRKTPFYKEKLRNSPEISNLRDFQKLPFTVKDELRASQKAAPPFGEHQACERNKIKRIYMTSGTTGVPTFIGLTKEDLKDWIECESRSYWAAGFRPHNWIVSAVGAGPFIAGATLDAWQNIGCSLVPVGPGRTERMIDAFREGKADSLACTPSYAEYLLEYCKKMGIDPLQLGIKRVQFGGEPGWRPGLRSRIEAGFGCITTESLGMGDVSADFWGECEERNGMHFCGQGIIYPELIDTESLDNMEWLEGAEGELVYSHLKRECEPLIRFRSRDLVKVTSTECPCGRTTPLIRVLGRSDDMFKVKGVSVFPSSIKEIVNEFVPRVSGEFQVLLTHPATQTKAPVPINVELGQTPGDTTELKSAIEETIHRKLLFRAEISFLQLGSLTRSEYKTRLVRFLN